MSDIAEEIVALERRKQEITTQIAALDDERRELKRQQLTLAASHHGCAIGARVISTGYSHRGKTGVVVSFHSSGWSRDPVTKPVAMVNLVLSSGKIGEASHEFRDWELAEATP